jgi:hypothetical protein
LLLGELARLVGNRLGERQRVVDPMAACACFPLRSLILAVLDTRARGS